ncbi:unnamed protein product, partial [Nesidiocoris tenuis]
MYFARASGGRGQISRCRAAAVRPPGGPDAPPAAAAPCERIHQIDQDVKIVKSG